MRIRYVVITKDSDFSDVEALPDHPYVVKCWRLPRAYTLYELYHPVFDRIYDSDSSVSSAARLDPLVREQTREVFAEEKRLLAPLFREVDDPRDRPLHVGCKTAMYLFFGRGKKHIRWPELGTSVGWGEARTVRVSGRLRTNNSEKMGQFESVFKEWSDCVSGLGALSAAGSVRFSGEHFSVLCEFAEPCGDAAMALFMLLTATRNFTSLESVGFFHPADFSTPFLNRHGPGGSSQDTEIG